MAAGEDVILPEHGTDKAMRQGTPDGNGFEDDPALDHGPDPVDPRGRHLGKGAPSLAPCFAEPGGGR